MYNDDNLLYIENRGNDKYHLGNHVIISQSDVLLLLYIYVHVFETEHMYRNTMKNVHAHCGPHTPIHPCIGCFDYVTCMRVFLILN